MAFVSAKTGVASDTKYRELKDSAEKDKCKVYRNGVVTVIDVDDVVVGDKVSDGMGAKRTVEDFGEIYAYTYRQLVRTAEKRLFNLKEKLTVRYQEMSVKDYLSEVLEEPRQTELALAK